MASTDERGLLEGIRDAVENIAPGGGGAGDASAANQTAQITVEQAIQAAVQVMDDWDESDRAKVNIIAGQAGISAGAGAVAANTPRVTHASDDPTATVLGATTGAAVTSDATGTLQQYLRGLVVLFAARFPVLGQALAAASVPVVLPAAQITTLTPPAAITNFATETGGNLAAQTTALGAVNETAPADDTASSGLNGRLQRVAQNLTELLDFIAQGYVEGDVDSTIKGTAVMWEDASDTLRAASESKPLPARIDALQNTVDHVSTIVRRGTVATYTAAPTSSATLLKAASTTRVYIVVQNVGAQDVYIGYTNAVTTSNGVKLAPGASMTIVGVTATVYGITASGTGDIRGWEVVE